MTVPHGKDAYLSIDGTALTGDPGYVDTQSLDRVRDLAETSVIGQDDKDYIAGQKGATIQIGGPWDPTVDAVMYGADDGASVVWVFGPEGNTAGDIQYSGAAFITNYNVSAPASGRVDWTASFTVTGAVARAAVGA